jgi:Zn-dependent protease
VSEIVAENVGFLRGLVRGIGTAVRSPRVLLLTAAVAGVAAADRFVAMAMPERPSLPIALAGVIPGAAARALVLVALGPRLIGAIREARGVVGVPGAAFASGDLGPAPSGPRDQLARTSLWLAIFSFVPFVHVAALLAGLRSLRRPGLFSVRGLVAAGLGASFTAGYVLAAAGHFLPRTRVPEPDLGFLEKADPSLKDAIALLGSSLWQEAIDRVEAAGAKERSWAAHCLVGVAQTRLGDHDAAGAAFVHAFAGAGPSPPAELHYFHGRLEMARGSFPAAEVSFTKALALDPALGDAERLGSLARNALELPRSWKIVAYGVILLFLLTTHEVGHAWAAWKLGDDTAMSQGRISLNPLRHLDPVGSVLLPALLLWRNADVLFGWARPVPVMREKLRNPPRDHMVVSFAGPGVNLVVCLGTFLLLLVACLGVRAAWPGAATFHLAQPFGAMAVAGVPSPRVVGGILLFVRELLFTSLVLGCFNLLPVPPLDGSWILSGLLPKRGQALYEQLRRWSFVLFLVLVMTPAFDVLVAIPAGLAWGLLHLSLAAMGFA